MGAPQDKNRPKSDLSCIYQKIVVPLQRESTESMILVGILSRVDEKNGSNDTIAAPNIRLEYAFCGIAG